MVRAVLVAKRLEWKLYRMSSLTSLHFWRCLAHLSFAPKSKTYFYKCLRNYSKLATGEEPMRGIYLLVGLPDKAWWSKSRPCGCIRNRLHFSFWYDGWLQHDTDSDLTEIGSTAKVIYIFIPCSRRKVRSYTLDYAHDKPSSGLSVWHLVPESHATQDKFSFNSSVLSSRPTLLTRINVVATWKLSAPGESGEPRIKNFAIAGLCWTNLQLGQDKCPLEYFGVQSYRHDE